MTVAIRVLYVDDESDLLDLTKMYLEQVGDITVTTVMNAPNAIQLLEKEKFDAIVSDYQMPVMDGIQFLVCVRTRFGSIPFILFTGKGREDVIIQAINSGADFYLQKGGDPIAQFAELSHKIKSAASRKRAEDSLRKSEAKYRHLIEHSDEAIIVAQDGMLKLVNPKVVEFTGYSEQELLSMSFLEFIHPDDRAMVGERYQKRLHGEEAPARYRFSLSPKAGDTRWVELSVVAISWEGRPATLNFLTDITERKQAEDALRESEERYRNVVEDQTEFICRFLPDGIHVFVNEAYCRYFGKTREEIIGHRFRPRIPPEDRESVTRLFASLTPVHPVEIVDQRIVMPEGSIRWQRWSDRAIFSADGNLKEYQSVGRDITDRKRDEEELQEREEKFRTLAESSPDYIMRYDKHCRHTYMNPAGLRVSGLTEDQVLGKTHRESGFDENMSRFWEEKITGVFTTKKPYKTQFTWESVNGRVVLDWMLTPEFSLEGTVRSVLGVSRDITQLKKSEEELLRKNEELHASNEQISATEEELRQQVEEITGTQQALRASEERYHSLFEGVPIGLYRTTPSGQILDINPALVRLLCYPDRESLLAVNVSDLYADPGDRNRWQALVGREGIVRNFEVQFRTYDGTVIWVRDTSEAVCDDTGHVLYYNGNIEDITGRKQANEALREREELYRTLVTSVNEAIILQEKTGEILTWNSAAEQLFGVTAKEVLGHTETSRKWKTIREDGTEFLDTEHPSMHTLATGEAAKNVIMGITSAYGRFSWVNINTNPLFREGDAKPYAVVISLLDITERKQAEEALVESENRYRMLIEKANEVIFIIQDSRICFGNPKLEQIGKYTMEELAQKPFLEFVHPQDRALVGEQHKLRLAGESLKDNYAFRIVSKEGSVLWMDINASLITWNRRPAVLVLLSDITDRKRAEAALKDAALRWQSTFDSTQDAICIIDADQRIVMCNRMMQDIVAAKNIRDLVGLHCFEVVHKTMGSIPGCPFVRMRDSCTREQMELKIGERWFLVAVDPILDETGKLVGAVHNIRDITERKHMEEVLKKSEEQYRTLAANLPEIVYRVYLKENGRMQFFNDQVVALTGYTEPELSEGTICSIEPLIHADDRQKVVATVEKAITEGGIFAVEYRLIHKDGSIRSFNERGRIIYGNENEPLYIDGMIQDVTERKKIEDTLRKSKEQYHSLLENVPELILVHRNGIILYTNPAAVKTLGYQPYEALNRQVSDFIAPEFHERVAAAIRRRISGEQVAPYEIEVVGKDGSRRTMIINGCQIEFEGTPAVLIILVDITDRKKMEEALRQKEAELHDILEGSPISNFVIDRDHRVISWNKALEEATGFKAADMIGTTRHWQAFYDRKRPCLADLLVDEKTETILEWYTGKIDTVRLAGGAYDGTDFFPALGNAGKWLRFSASVIRDAGGYVIGAVETLQDVSGEKRSAEKICALQQFQQSIINNANVWISVLDAKGTILVWNTTAEQISGYPGEEVIGKNTVWKQLYPDPVYRKHIVENIFDIIKKGSFVENFETRMRTKSGDEKIIGWNTQPLRDASGTPAQFIAIGQDNTGRRQAEERINALRQFEESVIKNANIWISVLDGKGTVSVWNRAAEEISGYTAREVIGNNAVWSWMYPDKEYRNTVTATIKEVLGANKYLENFETRIRTKDGQEQIIWWNTRTLQDVPGLRETFIAIGKDVTEQKRLSDAVTLANKKLNLLSGITRHDIKNQLMALMAYLDLSRDGFGSLAQQAEYIKKAQQIAGTIDRQINLTKDYEEIGVKMPSWQNVKAQIQQAITALPVQGVQVAIDCPDIDVFADPLIEKVFYNLLDNALRYGGERMTTVRFSARDADSGLMIQCEDDGEGIKAEDKSRLFIRGFGKHTGLGLFLSREILGITGITITENGVPGKGARFEIVVPKGMWRMKGVNT